MLWRLVIPDDVAVTVNVHQQTMGVTRHEAIGIGTDAKMERRP
jgi:hypothetical protein